MDFLDDLNERQREAVTSEDGPLLILAGAGSGKTKVLTYRIAYLIKNGIDPNKILAVTFTNKAAGEMKKRVAAVLGGDGSPNIVLKKNQSSGQAKNLWIGTFHSVCARILRKEIHHLGITNSFTIYDESDKKKLIEQCLKDLDHDVKKNTPSSISHIISSAKNELIDTETYANSASEYKEQIAAEVYKLFYERMLLNHALDFDDLLMYVVNIFELNPQILKRYRSHFSHIFIDEYQDTNRAQYKLASLLANEHHNICVVGDSDQSIYRWRGADIRNILNFEKDYPECKIVVLEQNYRSSKKILEAANALISNNTERKAKNLWSAKEKGEPITVFEANDEHQEANFVAKTIIHYVERGSKLSDFAVFYRVNAQSRVLEEAFLREGLAYRIIGGLKFYERQEIKDILAYLKSLINENDSISLQRIINRPRRGIGDTTIAQVNRFAKENRISFIEALTRCREINQISSGAMEKIEAFLSMREKLKTKIDQPLVKFVTSVLYDTGYVKNLKENLDPEAQNRLDNINEFINVVVEFEHRHPDLTVALFLEEISLISDVDKLEEEEDSITMMTMHSAKGLEFNVVFVTGLEEGLFPHFRSLFETAELEEERRLCYVSLTRAMQKLFLTSSYSRNLYGTGSFNAQSRFVAEIPLHLLESAQQPTIQPVLHEGQFEIGNVVEHKKFGKGIITELMDDKITIRFETEGSKTLLAGYAPISLVG